MTDPSVERSTLELVRNQLEEQGYTVILAPHHSSLPPELKELRPDAIAMRNDEKVVITVKVGRDNTAQRIDDNTAIIVRANQAGWGHLTYFVNTPTGGVGPRQMSRSAVLSMIDEIERLRELGHRSVALLASWATLEAIARATQPSSFAKPQTPGRIINQLGAEGILTPDQVDFLRPLVSQRNAFVHGDLSVAPDKETITRFVAILRSLSDAMVTPRK